MGFGAAETAKHPFGMDEDVDEGAFDGAEGLVVGVVVGSEGVEIFAGFVADDFGFAVYAGFAGVLTGGEFAGLGTRAGRFLRIATIREDLDVGGHNCAQKGKRQTTKCDRLPHWV